MLNLVGESVSLNVTSTGRGTYSHHTPYNIRDTYRSSVIGRVDYRVPVTVLTRRALSDYAASSSSLSGSRPSETK